MLREHSAILSTFIKLPFVFKTFVLSIFEWSLKTGLLYWCFILGEVDMSLEDGDDEELLSALEEVESM